MLICIVRLKVKAACHLIETVSHSQQRWRNYIPEDTYFLAKRFRTALLSLTLVCYERLILSCSWHQSRRRIAASIPIFNYHFNSISVAYSTGSPNPGKSQPLELKQALTSWPWPWSYLDRDTSHWRRNSTTNLVLLSLSCPIHLPRRPVLTSA